MMFAKGMEIVEHMSAKPTCNWELTHVQQFPFPLNWIEFDETRQKISFAASVD